MTRKGYDTEHLISLLRSFRRDTAYMSSSNRAAPLHGRRANWLPQLRISLYVTA
ncbi:MAG: hypothetical protein MZV63_03895 [Marinilabiliales bacterium]|nr:hypothetical protein [Marinilabiliales bacterium]